MDDDFLGAPSKQANDLLLLTDQGIEVLLFNHFVIALKEFKGKF